MRRESAELISDNLVLSALSKEAAHENCEVDCLASLCFMVSVAENTKSASLQVGWGARFSGTIGGAWMDRTDA